jgi:hypothetical protein
MELLFKFFASFIIILIIVLLFINLSRYIGSKILNVFRKPKDK